MSLIRDLWQMNVSVKQKQTKNPVVILSMTFRGLASTDWSHSQITLSPANFWCWRWGSCLRWQPWCLKEWLCPLVVEAEMGSLFSPKAVLSLLEPQEHSFRWLQEAPRAKHLWGYSEESISLTRRGGFQRKERTTEVPWNILLPWPKFLIFSN